MSKSKVKCMLIVLFDCKGVVHKEFVPSGQTVNVEFYETVLGRLRKRVARVRPAIADSWKLHHDNAPSDTALAVGDYLAEHRVPTLSQPSHSPDVAPPDFFLFPRLKRVLKGRHHSSVKASQEAVTTELKSIPVSAFVLCLAESLATLC